MSGWIGSNPVTALKGIETWRVALISALAERSNPVTALKGIETQPVGLPGSTSRAGSNPVTALKGIETKTFS